MSTLARQALQKFSLNKLNHPCHFLGLLRTLCPYFDLCNSRPFLLMFPCGMLRLLYYFSISKNIIYSPFVFLFTLQYHPVLADQPTCYLSIDLCICHLLWTPTNDFPVFVSNCFFLFALVLCFHLHFIWAKKTGSPQVAQTFLRESRGGLKEDTRK